MFKKKSIYFLGIFLLLLGLLWLHSGHLLHAMPNNNHIEDTSIHEEIEHYSHNIDNKGHNVNLEFSILGLIPTLLGVFLIDKHNRVLGRH